MYSVSVVLFSDSQLSYFACLRSRQIIFLVSVLLEFAEQSRFLCSVSVDFGSRLLSMVPLSKSFHKVLKPPQNNNKKTDEEKKEKDSMCGKTVEH